MYDYKEQKKVVFTEEGQKMFLAIRDNVKRLIKEAGGGGYGTCYFRSRRRFMGENGLC